ncbi:MULTISPECIES: DUF354 domain-containing protein [Haloferax]|uniref:DUF354 domain-containing protein n=1 Tax=Haloferax marinum TaxID=2666143 RepID=A0A6A8G8T3_9EURY|nr:MULTISPECIES: DUF354 domain-containing protein [Haloferax]KAB1198210.1 DUF354 domain-containing protein [Haloferax sp. CBA1150]MRW97297.1 DUF354 domain-containing protein [Haloferax marinum]
MDVLFGIGHPAHVHFYKNAISKLKNKGYDVHAITKRKPLAIELLERYSIDYTIAGRNKIQNKSLLKTGLAFISFEIDVLNEVRKHNPSIVTGVGSIALSHASSAFNCKSLIFTDTENAKLANTIAFPFSDYIYTPECFEENIGRKQFCYPGYHELAYLHPNWFEPDPTVLDEAGVDPDERFVILRLVSWDAIHDIGDGGFEDVQDVISKIEDTDTRVLITSEESLPDELEPYQISIEPHRIHHLMNFASLFIGESATMATESAVLGTPSIFVSTSQRGYTNELEDKYRLVFNFSEKRRQRNAINKAISILENYDRRIWEERRDEMLGEKIDTTGFLLSQIMSLEELE